MSKIGVLAVIMAFIVLFFNSLTEVSALVVVQSVAGVHIVVPFLVKQVILAEGPTFSSPSLTSEVLETYIAISSE